MCMWYNYKNKQTKKKAQPRSWMGETQIFPPGSRLPSIFYGRLKINWTNQAGGLSVTGVFGSSRKSMVGNRVRSVPTPYLYPNPTMNLAQTLSKMESHRGVCPIVEGLIAEAAQRLVVLDGEHWLDAGPVPVPALAPTQPNLMIMEQAEQIFDATTQRNLAYVKIRELEAAQLPLPPSVAHPPPSPPRTPSPSPPPTPSVTPALVPAAVGPAPGFGKGGAPWSRGNGVKRYIRRRKPRNQNPNPAKRMRVLDYFSADNLKPAPAPRTRRPPKPYPQ